MPDRLAVAEATITSHGFERVPDRVAEVEDAARQPSARPVQALALVRRDDARLERAVLEAVGRARVVPAREVPPRVVREALSAGLATRRT